MNATPIEQLIVVRRLFRDAERQAGVGDDINAMQATLLLDLAVESFLSAVVHHLRPDTDLDSIKFNTLLAEASDAVEAVTAKRLPLGSKVRQLRSERNCVQHAAARRHPIEVGKLLVHTHDFLRHGFLLAFALDFDSFGPIDALATPRVRAALKQAELGLSKGDLWFCRGVVVFMHDEIVELLRKVKSFGIPAPALRSVGRMSNSGTRERSIVDAAERDVTSLTEQLNEELVRFRDELVVVGLGLPLGDVRQFTLAAGRRHGYQPDTEKASHDDLDEKTARFLLQHVVEVARLAEVAEPKGLAELKLDDEDVNFDAHVEREKKRAERKERERVEREAKKRPRPRPPKND